MAATNGIHLQGAQVKTVCKAVIGLYAVLCIAAPVMIPLNAAGMAGEPDPLIVVSGTT